MLRKMKNRTNIKIKFKEITSCNYYTRVDPNHILDIYIGLNDNAQYTLEYRGSFEKKSIKESSSILIKQGANDEYNYLLISLKDSKMFDTFCALCEDIIDSTRLCSRKEYGYETIINRLHSWRRLFSSKREKLQESIIMGILGELLFMDNYLFPTYGQHESLLSWSGQELTHKDFSMNNIWYEVKAVHTGKQTVRISSLEQLQSNNAGELAIVYLEKMSEAFDGIYLSKLATSILNEITSYQDKDLFLNQLYKQGYQFNTEDDRFVYDLTSIVRFRVDTTFPKLIRKEINDSVVQAQYDLDINSLYPFVIEK